MNDNTEPPAPPGKLATLVISAVMFTLGLIMALHGLNILSAQWLNPNPKTPQWVFAMIGTILILAAWLTLGTNRQLPRPSINVAGYTAVGLSLVMAHWLIFFAEGTSCSGGTGGLLFSLPGLFCTTVMAAAIIAVDLILAAAAIASLRSFRKV